MSHIFHYTHVNFDVSELLPDHSNSDRCSS